MFLWIWFIFLFFFLLFPLGWGWGYRGWGPPRPYYWRRRGTAVRGTAVQGVPAEGQDTGGWGCFADILWFIFIVAIIWIALALIF